MDKNTVEPSKKNVRGLLLGSDNYSIPKYQRPFSWGKDEAEELYVDLFKGNPDYFLGNILLNRKSDNILEVIDGQQRITSLSLLFLTLYLHCREKGIKDADDVRAFLQKGSFGEKTNTLRLSKINSSLYEELLSKISLSDIAKIVPENDSDRKILDVVSTFEELLKKDEIVDINLETKRLTEILHKITDNVFFIVITAENTKQASKLFEILNNKGVNLTQADLVRNYLLSKSDEQGFADSVPTWESLEKKIGIDNLEQFLRYASLLISERDSVYERIFEYSEKNSSKTTIDFLYKQSDRYQQILDPGSYSENPQLILEDFNVLGITQMRPVLMAVFEKFNEEEVSRISNILVNFAFRYSVICGRNPNKIEALSRELSYKIYNNQFNFDDVCKKIKELSPNDVDFKNAFLAKSFKSNKIPRYIIAKIEDFMSTGEKIIDWDAVHLEHIMPKKIDKWQKADTYFDEAFHSENVNKLGNMVLLSMKINTKIKNSLFSEKKTSYGGSDINLIKEIKGKTSWKKEEIDWNANRYHDVAQHIWKSEF